MENESTITMQVHEIVRLSFTSYFPFLLNNRLNKINFTHCHLMITFVAYYYWKRYISRCLYLTIRTMTRRNFSPRRNTKSQVIRGQSGIPARIRKSSRRWWYLERVSNPKSDTDNGSPRPTRLKRLTTPRDRAWASCATRYTAIKPCLVGVMHRSTATRRYRSKPVYRSRDDTLFHLFFPFFRR